MHKLERPKALPNITIEIPTPCGEVYVHVSFSIETGQPMEVFARLGKSGGCASAVVDGLTTTLSKALRYGADPEDLAKGLVGVGCHRSPVLDGGDMVTSCVDALGRGIREAVVLASAAANGVGSESQSREVA